MTVRVSASVSAATDLISRKHAWRFSPVAVAGIESSAISDISVRPRAVESCMRLANSRSRCDR